jgi:TraM recognition site of TraD and TraG/Type IV secretion-system coupling protein DNA-binding domain
MPSIHCPPRSSRLGPYGRRRWRGHGETPIIMDIPIGWAASNPRDILNIPCNRHQVLLGITGTGKSTLLKNMIIQKIRGGEGVTVLDPHGQLVDDLIHFIPASRLGDVIWFDPCDDPVIGLNFFDGPGEDHKKVSSILSMFSTIWEKFWGPQSNEIVAFASDAILEQDPDERSILAVAKFLVNPTLPKQRHQKKVPITYRQKCLRRSAQYVCEYWRQFSSRSVRDQADAVSHPMNKINEFVRNPIVRCVVGQTSDTVDLRRVMDERRILLCRLSKGRLGADVSSILGSLLVSKLSLAALERENVPEYKRRPHTLFADEVQNFVHGVDFPTILAEARKYHLTLTIATQTISQLPDPEAVFGNCNIEIAYRLGGKDAELMAQEWGNQFPATAFMRLNDFCFYANYVKNEVPQRNDIVYRANPEPSRRGDEVSGAAVKMASRSVNGHPRGAIEDKLDRFLGMQ